MEPMPSSSTEKSVSEASSPTEMDLSNPNYATELGYSQCFPNLKEIFDIINQKLFDGRIDQCCYVKYSRFLQSVAGVTTLFRAKDPFGIRISWPILRVRPLYDILDTLLHECIHAFLESFDQSDADNQHGQNFLKEIQRIENQTKYEITVDSDFQKDDLERNISYYRCNGDCRKWPPFFGVARGNVHVSTQHSEVCKGQFINFDHCGGSIVFPKHFFNESDESTNLEEENQEEITCFICKEHGILKNDICEHWNECLKTFCTIDEGMFLDSQMEEDVEKSISLHGPIPYACPLCYECFDKEELLKHLENL